MVRIEHIYSLINSKTLEGHLALYKKAGFIVNPKTVRHPPGTRNGFVYIGSEYIEFLWVENKKEFKNAQKALPWLEQFKKHPAPYGYGFESPDVQKFHASLVRRGFKIPDVSSRGPADAKEGDAPWWSFQYFSKKFVPGVLPFVLTYEKRRGAKEPRKIHTGKNKISALTGVTFVSKSPSAEAKRWQTIFAPATKVTVKNDVSVLKLDSHVCEWMTSATFKKIYGIAPSMPPSGKFASMRKTALLHLLSENLTVTAKYLKHAGWKVLETEKSLYVVPQKSDGFTFLVHKR